jgi:N-acylglucosamine 2-epimerase
VEFTEKHGFRPDGAMYYGLTREGVPLLPKQDVYTELSTVLGYTEYARAAGEEHWYERAREIFLQVWDALQNPGQAGQGVLAEARRVRLHGHSMITMNVLQEMRRFRQEPVWDEYIDICIDTIVNKHLKEEKRAVFELVGWEGDELPGSMGRWINPGHMIEGGIFFIHEGRRRKDQALIQHGFDFIRWGFAWGWDKEYGGVFNDVDVQGLPFPAGNAVTADSKLWWQHAEALHGLLLAYVESGEESYLRSYQSVHAYSFARFADPVYGEWYANLDRRGNHIGFAKGTARKNPFHIARNFLNIYLLLRGLV